MAGLFNLAADRALHMSQPPPPKISIAIEIGQPPGGGGGLSSVQKRMNIGGEPHRLSYINSDEASLLKQLGGSGRPVNGVPAYYFDSQDFSFDWGAPDAPGSEDPEAVGSARHQSRADIAQQQVENTAQMEADITAAEEEKSTGLLSLGIFTPENFQNFLGRLAAGALGTVVGGPLGAFVGYQYGPEIYEWAKKEGYLDWLDLKGDPESPYFGPPDEFPTEPVPEDKVEEKEKEEEEEEEEEEGRWDKYYREREERGPIDPYKGFEKTLKDIYGENWREIMERSNV